VVPGHGWSGTGWKVYGVRGGKLPRSPGELRSIAPAFVVAGPQRFAKGVRTLSCLPPQ